MKLEIELDVPDEAIDKTLEVELTRLAKQTAVLQLFANGKISSGRGAGILDMGRIQFLDLLRQRDIPFTVELDEEDFRMPGVVVADSTPPNYLTLPSDF